MTTSLSPGAVPDAALRDAVAAELAAIACAAGVILRGFETGTCGHHLKADGSPTSEADLAAETHIIAALRQHWPDIPVVAEETASTRPAGPLFFLVDPLDGTRDFLKGTGEYCVNIALVAQERPVAAAMAAPALRRVWSAGARAVAAEIIDGRPGPARPIAVRPVPREGMTALVSRRHGEESDETCLAGLPVGARRPASSALKFGLIAAGEADLYVRSGPTMEWDTAAGDHILTQAGGCVVGHGGRPVRYGRAQAQYLNGPFAALGDPSYADRVVLPETCPEARAARA
ncbi:3'(2'),5'-bisphosphate nucleotidase CysQ family protein [Methylobacterium isbiliense]|jgi:3'(2'), 5'-bisphosphate nucleotidase|uniref:3'(2'),5-bisphosphonucleoside 3'(2')-phosphohydrolase n=1 Tax=Methylobacterium isbiliense TaxID=315478 RepID=A0ABQ4SCH3_9HYPH|nr:3'(2'),5'-bisphosphate nucleotidase CysQ [Methylobacterium isbiliense]MDN3626143.1 3'(2'),5'-bisphosphate nucleotidase CysQ [Methylobacterium isbiliense]GJE00229.1 3'(2'),5'-bisphosphate nucleotidase CysQ [Methylobacterium isbiliense]